MFHEEKIAPLLICGSDFSRLRPILLSFCPLMNWDPDDRERAWKVLPSAPHIRQRKPQRSGHLCFFSYLSGLDPPFVRRNLALAERRSRLSPSCGRQGELPPNPKDPFESRWLRGFLASFQAGERRHWVDVTRRWANLAGRL